MSLKNFNPSTDVATGFPEPLPVPFWKRLLDLLLLAATLPITGPICLFLALWVRLLSKGPILFVQERVGYGGRRFGCLKFRTMYHGCDAGSHARYFAQLAAQDTPMTKLDAHDPRLLPGARWVRALGLDEMPQLINVWRGQMSWVGPRPCTVSELEQYGSGQRERFCGLPGLTGLWQVSGKNSTTFRRMVELDIAYLRTASLLGDLRIMAATPWVLFSQALRVKLLGRPFGAAPSVPSLPEARAFFDSRFPQAASAMGNQVVQRDAISADVLT